MRRANGFTLVELMVVVAIIAILAGIALPMFSEYIRKGKRAEAVSAIGDMQLREERFRADNPKYGNSTDAGYNGSTTFNLLGSTAAFTSFNNGLKYYSISISNAGATTYTITATRKGDLANDPKCGNFTLTYDASVSTSGTKGVSSGDVNYCWRQN